MENFARRNEEKLFETLKEREQRYQAVIDTAVDAIIQCKNGNVSYWNKSAQRIFGYKAAEVIGKDVTMLMSKIIAKKHLNAIHRFLSTGESKIIGKKPYETCAMRKDGSRVPVELSLAVNNLTREVSFTGIIRDISERKKIQAELEAAYEKADKISKTLQQSLLPNEIPQIEGLEIKFYYQATGEGDVGGDFYDVFETALNSYGIIVGDVSGKGVEVAAQTARVKYLTRDRAYDGSRPNEVISMVNNAVRQQEVGRFAALTYALYDPFSSIIEISNAGNPFPYNSRKDSFLEIIGVPVSIFANQEYSSAVLRMKKGDLVLIYTDGIVEARHDNELFGEERVRQFIRNNQQLSLQDLLTELVEEARIFSNDNLRDDILVVGIKKL